MMILVKVSKKFNIGDELPKAFIEWREPLFTKFFNGDIASRIGANVVFVTFAQVQVWVRIGSFAAAAGAADE